MKLRQGFLRIGLGSVAEWFVFWTCTYVLNPYSSLKPDLSFFTRISAESVVVPCVAFGVLVAGWIVAAFRED